VNPVYVSGAFDDLRSWHVRFLEEAARLGDLHVFLWSDESIVSATCQPPKFPLEERQYLLESIRYVSEVTVQKGGACDCLPLADAAPGAVWAVPEREDGEDKREFCASRGLGYRVLREADLAGFPPLPAEAAAPSGRKKVIVTGCYDWFHSGHVRFFEEASALGDLYVVVGHDANVRLLKGEGHPLFPQDERRYLAQSVRFVKQALISSGQGWMDAEPEIAWLKPDVYAVNEDGDKPEKRAFCAERGLEYVVLRRAPRPGLQRRTSSGLRGF
jgi:cytidyltransferase-like protein